MVVVANRLPVDRHSDDSGNEHWRCAPGGLVTALGPVMATTHGAWVGWAGTTDDAPPPFDHDGMHLVPVPLSKNDFQEYYEGFSNGTLWPLYHDVIVAPEFHRTWWDTYVNVNQTFAHAAARQAAHGAVVWIHDYHLQLVPAMLRALRPDLRIAFFQHIPFPAVELFSQLPWREKILQGLLGADLVGFQRPSDAHNFRQACSNHLHHDISGTNVITSGSEPRLVTTGAFPISIDTAQREKLARSTDITAEVTRIRANMGGRKIILGVDRLDYIKGISHRLKAYGELLAQQRINPRDVVLVQVATPSRERVGQYMALRDEVELTVGRLNGDHSTLGRAAIHYLHQSFDNRVLAALYRAADVMLVTSLRDGMNLVAKEYVASRYDHRGVLVLSEFAGAADELTAALTVNPHDIEGLKNTIEQALVLPDSVQKTKMQHLRAHVKEFTVQRWAQDFLHAVGYTVTVTKNTQDDQQAPSQVVARVQKLARHRPLLVAADFDGTLAELVDSPDTASPTPAATEALKRLAHIDGVHIALISGRSLPSLAERAQPPHGTHLIAGHGAEVDGEPIRLTDDQLQTYAKVQHALEDIAEHHHNTYVEVKPTALVLHTRTADAPTSAQATTLAVACGEQHAGVRVIVGKDVVEISVADANKGSALVTLRESLGATATLYVGDDTTDEDAFEHLVKSPSTARDVTIKVGPGETAASARVHDPDEVAVVLHALADALET